MRKLKVGIIGAGTWGANHAKVFNALPQTELVAVCDISPDRLSAFSKMTHCPVAYTDFNELISDNDVEAVSVATPDFTHAPIILAALKANKHVLAEKPLAMTLKETEEIALAAKSSSAKLMVDFHNRVNPAIVQVREAVSTGEIGIPVHGYARLSNATTIPLEMLSWSAKSSALWFLGSHVVDALRFILDDEIVKVYSVSRRGVLSSLGVDTQDVHLSMLEFSKGTIIHMENSWILSAKNPILFDFKIELVGEKGQVKADPSHNGAVQKLTSEGTNFMDILGEIPTGQGRVGGFVLESIARFVDAVLGDAPLLAGIDDGLAATRVLAAIEQSCEKGIPINL